MRKLKILIAFVSSIVSKKIIDLLNIKLLNYKTPEVWLL